MRRFDLIFWGCVATWALVSAGLSTYGWNLYSCGRAFWCDLETTLDTLSRTTYFFFGEPPDIKIPDGNYALKLGRFMAPLATLATIIRVGLMLFAAQMRARRIRRMHGHTVVCGATKNGVAFAESEARRGRDVVLVGKAVAEATELDARLHGYDILTGDPLDRSVLEAAAISKAERLIVVMTEDSDNLEIAMLARDLVEVGRKVGPPLIANVGVARRELWRQLVISEAVERRRKTFEMLPFNLSSWAARELLWREPLSTYANLRTQDRVHAVFIGFDDYTEALIGHLPPTCVYPDFRHPLFTVLTADEDATNKRLGKAYPHLREVADLNVLRFSPDLDRFDEGLMQGIEDKAPVTAIIVCLDADDRALSTAIYLQDAMRRTGFWKAPIYLRLSKYEGIGSLLVSSSQARRFQDVLESFGVEDRLCNLETLEGRLEELAQALHLAYLGERGSQPNEKQGVGRSVSALSEWRNLEETYRVSNRRAVDHISTKLASAGAFVPPGYDLDVPSNFHLIEDRDVVERLAALEHESWKAGRHIDGWKYGVSRDDQKKLHPNLVEFDQLDEPTKDFDRQQIELIDRELLNRVEESAGKKLTRFDHWIGLIGGEWISPDDGQWLRESLRSGLLDEIVGREPEVHFTLLTSLALGSEYVMAKTLASYFEEKGLPYRMLVIEAVPEHFMLTDYRDAYERGAVWNGQPRKEGTSWEGTDKGQVSEVETVQKARQGMIAAGSTQWLVDLTAPNLDYSEPQVRKKGYLDCARYIIERSKTLFVSHRFDREQVGSLEVATSDSLKTRENFLRDRSEADWKTVVLELDTRCIRKQHVST